MPSGRGLGEDRGGSSAVEHAIVLSLVALSALGAFVALGDEMGLEVDCTASTIRGGGTPCRGSRGARGALGALGGTPTPSPETGSRRPSGATQAALTARSAGGEGDDATRAASGAISTTPATPARVQGVTESTPARESIGPAVGSTAPPPPSDPYAMEVHVLVVDAIAHFRQLAGEDDEITRAELERLSRGPGAVGELARELLRHRSLLRALDIGAGRGEVDGKISQADVDETLLRVQRREDLYDLLADSASGRGGRDEEVSRADLLALADDPSVPASLRARARREAASMPEDGDGCSWYRVDCHAVRIAKHVYHHPRAIPSFVGAFELGIERGVVNALKTTVTGTYQMAHEAAAYAVAHPMRALLLPQRLMLDPYFRARVLEIVGRQTLRGTVAYARATGHRIATCDTGVECGEAIGVPLGEIGVGVALGKGAGFVGSGARIMPSSTAMLERAYRTAGPSARAGARAADRGARVSAAEARPYHPFLTPTLEHKQFIARERGERALHPTPEGYTDVSIHGSPSRFATARRSGRRLSANMLASELIARGYTAGHIRLISCSVGRSRPFGMANAAQQLADELQTTVIAATRSVYAGAGFPLTTSRGAWRVFRPLPLDATRAERARARAGRVLVYGRDRMPERLGASVVILVEGDEIASTSTLDPWAR